MIERTTVRLPEALLARARKKAAQEGRTLTSLIEEGLREVLARKPQSRTAQKREPLPVSTATGGFQPGVDINRMADIYEQEDIEQVSRLRRSFQE